MSDKITIKCLDDILAEMHGTTATDVPCVSFDTPRPKKQITAPIQHSNPKQSNPSHAPSPPQAAPSSSANTPFSKELDDAYLQALASTDKACLYDNDKANNRLRWLAFYYLSRRELSQAQLKQKLIDKDCDPHAVTALLLEFHEKGYQSDTRTALVLIREAVRKNRGIHHLKNSLRQAELDLGSLGGLEHLMAQAGADIKDDTALEVTSSDVSDTHIDWLRLAVTARAKKYGSTPPNSPKDKARQLRFLQYRGFTYTVCLDALKLSPEDLEP